jgi:hypothetical protein
MQDRKRSTSERDKLQDYSGVKSELEYAHQWRDLHILIVFYSLFYFLFFMYCLLRKLIDLDLPIILLTLADQHVLEQMVRVHDITLCVRAGLVFGINLHCWAGW